VGAAATRVCFRSLHGWATIPCDIVPVSKGSENNLAIEHSREQRRFGRRSVFKAAVIEIDSGLRIEGTVLDLSDGGAKVRVADPAQLIGEFYLEIPADDLIIRCRLVYAEDGVVGVQFIKPPRRISWLKK